MRLNRVGKGKMGEEASVKLLEKKGYKVLERNYRTRFGEIDVVCLKGNTVVFVEVKSKTGERFGEPWEMIDKRKLGQVERIAKMYLIKRRLGDMLCRIDVVGVWLREEKVERLKHWEDVGGDLT